MSREEFTQNDYEFLIELAAWLEPSWNKNDVAKVLTIAENLRLLHEFYQRNKDKPGVS